nr:DUF2332 family protein [Microbispora sp. KK1-11]
MTTAANYAEFAAREAHGVSPAYERLALAVSRDRELLALLGALPPAKRQPNLLFAVVRFLGRAVPLSRPVLLPLRRPPGRLRPTGPGLRRDRGGATGPPLDVTDPPTSRGSTRSSGRNTRTAALGYGFA